MAGHSHRSTLKHGHKPFKSKHASKGAIKNRFKGKIEKESSVQKQKKGSSKLERKNLAKQLRDHKITQTAESRKLFDGVHGAEKIITVIPLTDDVNAEEIVNRLIDTTKTDDQDASMIQGPSITSVRINKFKSNLKFIIPDFNNFVSILDAAKVADYVVFGLSGTSEVDPEYGEQIIRALELQGIAHTMGVVNNLSIAQPKEKFQLDLKQSLTSYFKHFFPAEDKIYNLENASDSLVAIRTLCQKFPKSITWRDSRGWIVADEVSWETANNSEDSQDGYLTVEGTVRGIGFNANRLIHIPGHGDFQIERIERIQRNDLEAFSADENQETLDELAPNEVSMEDWEAEEEYQYDDEAVRYENGFLPAPKVEKKKLNLPEGTSDYQAKWFLDDDVVEDDDSDMESEGSEPELMQDDEEMEVEDVQSEPADLQSELFVELSPEEEKRQLELYREKEEEDREFPDEIELNPNESGKERLKRYRGLKNLHNSVWDCDEYDPKAPSEWRRLLRISNFKGTKNKILKESIKETQVTTGSKVKIFIKAPQFITSKIANWKEIPFIIYGLLEHEHKLAVVNFSISPWEDYEKPIPSKEAIVVQYGPRRQVIQPVYSQASNSPNNVHKYERFLHKDSVGIATAIAPVNFTNSPAIFFKQSSESPRKIELIGHGSFLNAEHQRVLAKRAILTGHPLKIHKNVVTIRYMFFNSDDIQFFKAVPLFTKSGRSGFIKESLGTHGYFKANFDGKISSQDTVAMSLYKRVWPKSSIMWVQ